MKALTINGTPTSVPDEIQSIRDLVIHLGKTPSHVVVECGEAVFKGGDVSYVLQDGDTVEVVHFVGGGSDAFLGKRSHPELVEGWMHR